MNTNECGCDTGFILLLNGTCMNEPLRDPCEGKPYKFTTNGTCTADCGDGFYTNSTNFCFPCTPGCAVCTDP